MTKHLLGAGWQRVAGGGGCTLVDGRPKQFANIQADTDLPHRMPIVAPLSRLATSTTHCMFHYDCFFAPDERQQGKQLRFGNVVSNTDSNHCKRLSAQSNEDGPTLCGWPTRQSRELKSCPNQRLSGSPALWLSG